jgi:dihydroorotate dehydrogenase
VRRSLLLLALVALAAGCAGSSKRHTSALTATGPTPAATTGTSTSQATPTQVKYRYPRVLQRSFLVSCVKNGGTTAACACTLHSLQERMPVEQFVKLGRAFQAKRKPPAALERKFKSSTVQCARNSS